MYKSARCFLPICKSIGLLVQEKKQKDFQDGVHLGFPIGTISAFFDLKVPRYFLSNSKPTGLLVQEKKRKNFNVQFPIGIILAIFDLHVTPMLCTKFRINWPRSVGGIGFYVKKIVDAARRTTHDGRCTTHDG